MEKTNGLAKPEMPFSLEDENYIISQMYLSVERAETVLTKVEFADIFNSFNRKVFRVIERLTDAGLIVTSHSVVQELTRSISEEQGGGIPFDSPTVWELQNRYQVEYMVLAEGGLEGAINRVKQDRAYREIIYLATDALLMARAREGNPVDIIAPLEELNYEMQKSKGSVIVWADEAERKAQERYDAMDRGEIFTIPTGFPEVDRKLWGGGKGKGDLVIVSGVTSGGKTALCLNMQRNAAELKIPSIYFTTEMEVFRIFARQHGAEAKIPGYKIRPKMSEMYPGIRQRLYDTGAKMALLELGYVDSVRDFETFRRVCKFALREYGLQEAYIDLLGHFKPTKRFRGSPFERQSLNAELAKEVAQELGITVTACVQLRRKNESEKGSKKERGDDIEGNLVEPTLDMLKNSGEIENSADTVAFVWGEKGMEGEQDALRHIYGKVAKQRNGGLFRFELKFAPSIFTFTSAEQLLNLRRQMEEAEF